MAPDDSERIHVAFWRIAIYFLRLGAVGFGGPIALVGRMEQDLVERRHWVTKREYPSRRGFRQASRRFRARRFPH